MVSPRLGCKKLSFILPEKVLVGSHFNSELIKTPHSSQDGCPHDQISGAPSLFIGSRTNFAPHVTVGALSKTPKGEARLPKSWILLSEINIKRSRQVQNTYRSIFQLLLIPSGDLSCPVKLCSCPLQQWLSKFSLPIILLVNWFKKRANQFFL